MGTDLLVGILASVIAAVIVGTALFKITISKKNSGITQENGVTQIAMKKSKNNSINIGVDSSEVEKSNKPE